MDVEAANLTFEIKPEEFLVVWQQLVEGLPHGVQCMYTIGARELNARYKHALDATLCDDVCVAHVLTEAKHVTCTKGEQGATL